MTANTDQILSQIDDVIGGFASRDGSVSKDAMRWAPAPVKTDEHDESPFGPVVDAYTRADALADGTLVAVPEAVAREAGITVPVALTRAAWEDCVAWDDADNRRKGTPNDEDGRLWDVLFMTKQTIRRNRYRITDRARVQLYRVPRPGRARSPRLVELVAVIGPGDQGEPVMTLMQPGED